MTLTTPYQASFYVGDGETKAFPFTFEELSDNFIKVIVLHIDGTTSIPTYIVDLDLKQVVFGDETPAPTADDVVCIYRETPTIQDTPFKTLEGYNAKALENILSKIVAMIQEIKSNYFSTQVLQGDPWQLDLLSSADDGATVNIDFTAKKLIKGLYFKITDGNLQVSADDSNYITMPKSSDIVEFRQTAITLPDLSVVYKLEYRVGNQWFEAGNGAQATADAALALAQSVESDLSSHTTDLNNPHATSISNLTDTDIDAPTAGQFMKYDGLKWVNADSSATVSFGDIEGDPDDNTALANALNDKADSSDVYTKNEVDTALNNKADKATTLGGYNISDAYTKGEIDTALADKADSSDVYTKSEVDTALADKADSATTLAGYGITDGANTDLSNLTATGANIANWSSNVTNCITEIPQDIKLELFNGTLTLKAGSKVYVPNGAGVFDEVTIASDIITTYAYGAFTLGVYYNSVNSRLEFYEKTAETSGTTPPSGNGTFYNTTANKISRYNGGVIVLDNLSFPIATITTNASQITSIDQVFNGFGYIGSTVFALPGVKGLIPNGRNTDGSLKNTESVTTSIITGSIHSGSTNSKWVVWVNNSISTFDETDFYYDSVSNYIRQTSNNKDVSLLLVGKAFAQPYTTQITKLEFKQVFRAVDYSDTEYIAHQAMPSNRYVDLTLGASGTQYIAPANGYVCFEKQSTSAYQYVNISCNNMNSFEWAFATDIGIFAWLPVKKGDIFTVDYNLGGSVNYFRFVYAQGAQ